MKTNEDWVLIYSSGDKFETDLLKVKLENNGINVVQFDHEDSMYKSLNDTNYEVGLYVHKGDAERAKKIIQNKD